MIYIFYAYLIGSTLSIIWIAYIRFVLLDRENLNYSTDDLWMTYILTALIWAIMLLTQPRYFLKGRELFRINEDSVDGFMLRHNRRLKQLEKMAESPPLCGRVVLYPHSYIYDEEAQPTEILFKSDDIVTHFKGKNLPLPNHEENLAIVAWIKNRDDTHQEPTLIPKEINFKRMAINLINSGYGEITCAKCDKRYPAILVTKHRPKLHAGWNTETYLCPEGHEIMFNDWIHVNMKSDESGN